MVTHRGYRMFEVFSTPGPDYQVRDSLLFARLLVGACRMSVEVPGVTKQLTFGRLGVICRRGP